MRVLLAALLLAGPALAQDLDPAMRVEADLDRDGQAESYRLDEEGALTVAKAGWERVVPDAAWGGTLAGEQPGLAVNETGSVLLTSMNEAIGRERWRMTITIAHRHGDWRVAGYTYDFYDTLDPDAWGHCDLNLLSGRGVSETPAGTREVQAPAAPLLWDWNAYELPLPMGAICFD